MENSFKIEIKEGKKGLDREKQVDRVRLRRGGLVVVI